MEAHQQEIDLILISLIISDTEQMFHVFLGQLYFFREMPIQVLGLFRISGFFFVFVVAAKFLGLFILLYLYT